MAKANTDSTLIPSRRAVLAGIAAAPALAAPALALSGPDPIFAAIEAHVSAARHFHAVDEGVGDLHSCWFAGTGVELDPNEPQECHDAVVNSWNAYKAESAAFVALLTTRPTTIAGSAALLDYAAAHSGRHASGRGIGHFHRIDEPIPEALENFYQHLADSLRAIGGVS